MGELALGISLEVTWAPHSIVSAQLLTVILVVIVALGFDFTNGFHDTGNSMATTIATGALKPKIAVALAAVLNLVGAFLSVAVALTVTNAVVSIQDSDGAPDPALTADHGSALLLIILAGLVGGIVWNLLTWLLGLPSSSSHALFGGLIGATIAGIGWGGVNWTGDGTKLDGVVGKVILPALASPVIAAIVSVVGTWLIFRVTARARRGPEQRRVPLGPDRHRLADVAGPRHQRRPEDDGRDHAVADRLRRAGPTPTAIPLWVKVSCAVAIALGTYVGGWRIIRTMGKGITEIEPRQGTAAQGSAAAVILASSQLGFALSTTHVATGSILGSGLGKPGAHVRWRVAGRMAVAWFITLPMAALVGAATWEIGDAVGGGLVGALVMVAILVVASGFMYARSRRHPITAENVNDDWEDPRAVLEPSEPGRGLRRLGCSRCSSRTSGRSCSTASCSAPACRWSTRVGVRASALGTAGRRTASRRPPYDDATCSGKPLPASASPSCWPASALGLAYIWASGHGEQLSFEHGYPTFVPKS